MRLLFYLIFLLAISCKGKIDKNDSDYFSNLQFSLDTVIIDPGDEIIFLKHQLLNADMGKDGKYFLNFNGDDHTLERINLDELRLEEKIPFEPEGPNGTGPGVGMMKVHNDSQLTINNLSHTALFSLDGEKLMTINFENFPLGIYSMEEREYLKPNRLLDTDANRLYVLIYSYKDERYAFGILDLGAFEVTRLNLKSFEDLSDFDIIYTQGGSKIINGPQVHLEKFDTKVMLSNEITSTLIWYDAEIDSLFTKSYNSGLTANQKEKRYIKEHETIEEFKAEQRRLKQEIEGIRSKVYLTALDEDLNMLGETLIPQLTRRPGKHFAKDGKIWIYENIEDEMGFVRLDPQ